MTWLSRILGAACLLCLAAAPGRAGISFISPPDLPQDVDTSLAELDDRFPDILRPLSLEGEDGPASCASSNPAQTYAVLIGVPDPAPPELSEDQFIPQLAGPQNDVGLIASTLLAHGLNPEGVKVLLGEDAGRVSIAAALSDVRSLLDCNDSVLLYFSGHAAEAESILAMLEQQKTDAQKFLGERNPAVTQTVTDQGPYFLIYPSQADTISGLSSRAISDAALTLRNRGADVTVIFDTMYADQTLLQERHLKQSGAQPWSETVAEGGGLATPPDAPSEDKPVLLRPDAGNLTTLYAGSVATEMELPKDTPDAKIYGAFSFKIAMALQSEGALSPRGLALALQQFEFGYIGQDTAHILESTAPDAPIIAEQRSALQSDAILVFEPVPTRGAMEVTAPRITVRGQVEWPEPSMIVLVNRQQATLGENGEFTHDVDLEPGVTEIEITALTRDNKQHRRVIEVTYQGENVALLGNGARYAIMIANQNYAPTSGMADLSTPFADVEAIEQELTTRFGFRTTAKTPDGQEISLVLRDATRSQIELLLFRLSQVVGSDDTVMIYYAGHGIYEQVTGNAYWVPADAQAGVPPTYLSADSITDAVQRFAATNVIVVSDSCYSGALSRGGGNETPVIDEDRLRVLKRLAEKRSRILISSGANEPVADQGGQGHSVFARALLNGLRNMEAEAFSARELFDGFILHQVIERSEQEPQFRPIENAGHEAGDIVFVRSDL